MVAVILIVGARSPTPSSIKICWKAVVAVFVAVVAACFCSCVRGEGYVYRGDRNVMYMHFCVLLGLNLVRDVRVHLANKQKVTFVARIRVVLCFPGWMHTKPLVAVLSF